MEERWTDPESTGPDNPGATITRYIIGAAHMGSVIRSSGGEFYAVTQVRRLGAVGTFEQAKRMVEIYSIHDVNAFEVLGSA